eukprot:8823848-Pyramimonas_sp.AAC.1
MRRVFVPTEPTRADESRHCYGMSSPKIDRASDAVDSVNTIPTREPGRKSREAERVERVPS